MSLKAFHVLFIMMAILLAVGCAAWSYYNQTGLYFGIGSGVIALLLSVYGVLFLKKSRSLTV